MASLRDRLRAAAGVPEQPRTTPGQLRALVRRRRQRRRLAVLAASVLAVAVLGSGIALLARSQTTQRIEFADAPSQTPDRPTTGPRTSDSAGVEAPDASATMSRVPRHPESRESPEPSAPSQRGEPGPLGVPGAPQACGGSASAADIPDGATARQIADIDGDGHPDAMWLDASRNLGIITAAGGAATFAVESAAPSYVWALAADADGQPPVELLVSDGRAVQLLVFDDCEIVPVINTGDDRPWLFDLGFTGAGTGVGCVDIDGRRQLVGLNVEVFGTDMVEWSRTVVELDGRTATVGATDRGTFHRPADDYAIELLSEVTCGDLTMADDGLSTPTP